MLQAGHSSLPQQRLESNAELVAATTTAGGPFFSAQRRLESDAARRSGSTVAAGAGATPAAFYLGLCRLRGILPLPASHDHAAGGPFFFAAAKIRIGCGRRCRYASCRRNHSLLQRRLESDAEVVVATPAAGWPFFFAAAKIRIGCGTRCCHASCRLAVLLCRSED